MTPMQRVRAGASAAFCVVLAAAVGMTARGQEKPAQPPISFNRDIRPILSNNCFACHGPDEKQRETKFHFDTKEGAFAEAGIIEPGNAFLGISYFVWYEGSPS